MRKISTLRRKFREFLIDYGIRSQVWQYCDGDIDDKIMDEYPEDYLIALFDFSTTSEGASYWWEYHSLWVARLEYLDYELPKNYADEN
jgi:hypothetical protein